MVRDRVRQRADARSRRPFAGPQVFGDRLICVGREHDLVTIDHVAEELIRRATGSSRDLADEEHFVDMMVSLATAIILDMRGDAAAAAASSAASSNDNNDEDSSSSAAAATSNGDEEND